jgi:hypothetical protein
MRLKMKGTAQKQDLFISSKKYQSGNADTIGSKQQKKLTTQQQLSYHFYS